MKPNEYDRVIVAFSGGKDSLAATLHLLEMGVPLAKMELWHHDVDGGSELMDWPVTPSYCRAVAKVLDIPILFSWREGGFLKEMLRRDTPTAPVTFEDGNGGLIKVGGFGPVGTRLKFPQVSPNLAVRWCSAYLKIDVGRRIFANDPRFDKGRFLFVTGERREESASRAKYKEVEQHASSTRARDVTQWRAVIDWSEKEIWAIIERHRIKPHPAYYLGWGRVSCALCIFGDKDQWASAKELMPASFDRVADYEREFGTTIHRTKNIRQLAVEGDSFLPDDQDLRDKAMGTDYSPFEAAVREGQWKMPAGAFKKDGGPT